jgi:hypothetical protein
MALGHHRQIYLSAAQVTPLTSCGPWRARCHHSDRRRDSCAKSSGRAGSPARRFPGNYGPGAGANPDGVVAVTVGDATLVSGAVGGVVVVIVCPVACGTPGPTTCSGSAELTSPKVTPSAPMATTALTPIVADPNFHCFACTLTTPIRSVVRRSHRGETLNGAESQSRGPSDEWITDAASDETRSEPSELLRRGVRRRQPNFAFAVIRVASQVSTRHPLWGWMAGRWGGM